jgi:hypothetical protein
METHILTLATRARFAFSCAAGLSRMASAVRTRRRPTAAVYCQGVSSIGFLLCPFPRRERAAWLIPQLAEISGRDAASTCVSASTERDQEPSVLAARYRRRFRSKVTAVPKGIRGPDWSTARGCTPRRATPRL